MRQTIEGAWWWRWWWAAGLLLWGGCWCGDADEVAAPSVTEPMEMRRVTLSAAPMQEYARPVDRSPFDERVAALVSRLSSRSLIYDTCLSRAAAEYGRHLDASGAKPPRGLQEVVLHASGCTDGWVSTHLFSTSAEGEEEFFKHLEADFGAIDHPGTTHLGAGRARAAAPYRWTYVIFLAEREVEFAPMPRRVEIGEALQVRGRLFPGMKDPDVLVLEGNGEVTPVDVVEEADGRFEAAVEFKTSGEQWVELLARGELGPRVLALFPIHVGEPLPRRFELAAEPDESAIQAPEDAERLMFRLLNADRAQFGLPPLRWNDAIAAIARRHSRDMRDNNFFAHVSPYNGDLSKRFETARFPARSIGENISRNSSVYDAEAGLMQSLGHRENILSPHYTDVGIGVSFSIDAYGNRVMVLTQNFATPQRQLTGAQARDEILERLVDRRARRKLRGPLLDDDLQAVAARFARFGDANDGGYPATELTQRVKQALVEQGYRYRTFYVQTHTVLDPADVALPSALFEPGVSRVGIGVFPDRSRSGTVKWKTLILLVEL